MGFFPTAALCLPYSIKVPIVTIKKNNISVWQEYFYIDNGKANTMNAIGIIFIYLLVALLYIENKRNRE